MLNFYALIGAALILGASIILSSIIYWHGFSYESRLSHCTQMFEKYSKIPEDRAFFACFDEVR